jgi:hypothetical protein
VGDSCGDPITPVLDSDGFVKHSIEMSNFKINLLGDGKLLISKMEMFYSYLYEQCDKSQIVQGIINMHSIESLPDSPNIRFTFNTRKNILIHIKYSCNCNILI